VISETVVLEGHIIDSLTLSRVLDTVLVLDGAYEVTAFHMGRTKGEPSRAEIAVTAPDAAALDRILHEIGQLGAVRAGQIPVRLAPAPADGVFPDGFYSTTNLDTDVFADGAWAPVGDIEMDCGIVVRDEQGGPAAKCVPIGRIRRGDPVVVGDVGVRVRPLPRIEPSSAFHFMGSGVSSERRKEIVVAAVARAMRETREAGRAILLVGGPAIIHTGAGKYLEALINAGWVDVLFAGNALATHDIEHALYGTSLGVDMHTGLAAAHGHEHHLRAINAIRGVGSIAQAVESGMLTGGAIMVATTLHSVATGNLLPATVTTICVDNAADTVIKLMDRGTHQAFGLVTDCEFFLKELAMRMAEDR